MQFFILKVILTVYTLLYGLGSRICLFVYKLLVVYYRHVSTLVVQVCVCNAVPFVRPATSRACPTQLKRGSEMLEEKLIITRKARLVGISQEVFRKIRYS